MYRSQWWSRESRLRKKAGGPTVSINSRGRKDDVSRVKEKRVSRRRSWSRRIDHKRKNVAGGGERNEFARLESLFLPLPRSPLQCSFLFAPRFPSIWLHFTWNSHVSRVHSVKKKGVGESYPRGVGRKRAKKAAVTAFYLHTALSLFIRQLPFDTGVICIQKLAGNHRGDLLPSFLPDAESYLASSSRHPRDIRNVG